MAVLAGRSCTMRGFVGLIAGLCAIQLLNIASIARAAGSALPSEQRVTGTVSDALGRPLGGVDLIFQRQDGRIVASGKGDKGGQLEFQNILPGTYDHVSNKTCFATETAVV